MLALTRAVTVDSILSKHIKLPVLREDAAAPIIASCENGHFALQLHHFLRLVRLWLPATLGCKFKAKRDTDTLRTIQCSTKYNGCNDKLLYYSHIQLQ